MNLDVILFVCAAKTTIMDIENNSLCFYVSVSYQVTLKPANTVTPDQYGLPFVNARLPERKMPGGFF